MHRSGHCYLEFKEEVAEKLGFPGPIITVHLDYLTVNHHHVLSERVWYEDEDNDVHLLWADGKLVTTSSMLTGEDLDNFVWIKLRAINV